MVFTIFQILISVLLITAILMQQRGTALSSAFGGEGNVYATRRGAQKYLFFATVGLAALFIATAFLQLVLA